VVRGVSLPDTSEPASVFYYNFSESAVNDALSEKPGVLAVAGYRDFFGRVFNGLQALVLLPEDVALRLQEELEENPLFARKIVERMLKEKFMAVPGKNYIEPPYFQTRGKGLKMYRALDLKKPVEMENKQPHLFDPKNVLDLDSL
jgi:hypothetical protein